MTPALGNYLTFHSVAITYHSSHDAAQSVASTIESAGAEAMTVPLRLEDPQSAADAVQAVIDRWGSVDVLVANAVDWGGTAPPDPTVRFEVVPLQHWQRMISTNLIGTIAVVRSVLPNMRRNQWGRIVLISSSVAEEGLPGPGPYGTAKSGLYGLSRGLAWEGGRDGILVNVIAPGFTLTESRPPIPDAIIQSLAAGTPTRRLSDPDDVAQLIVFLGSFQRQSEPDRRCYPRGILSRPCTPLGPLTVPGVSEQTALSYLRLCRTFSNRPDPSKSGSARGITVTRYARCGGGGPGFDPWPFTTPLPPTSRWVALFGGRGEQVSRRRRYNRRMTPSLTPTAPVSSPTMLSFNDPFAGLTEADATRIARAMTAAIADSTRTVYAHAWRGWERWCATRAITPLPASPAAICAYLVERAEQGASAGTLDGACSAISYRHRSHGLDDPTLTEAVRQVRRGLRRTLGTAPQRLARPLSTADIRQIVTPIDRTTPKGARDAALILLSFASALRRSELTALALADVETKPGGLLVHVRRSKTDPEGRGQVVGVAHGQHALTDPVAAFATWAGFRGDKPGPLFVSLRHKVLTGAPISGEAVARMLRTRARAVGMSTERITGHSLRAGHATTAAAAGVPLDRIALQTRHKRLSTLIERYIRPAQALEATSSRDLGL